MGKTSSGIDTTQPLLGALPFLVPNEKGTAPFKVELTLFRDPKIGTLKFNVWYEDDDRTPHNHPWGEFWAQCFWGGYTEERWWFDDNGARHDETVEIRAGDVNHVPAGVYHRVVNVTPGTLTMMLTTASLGEDNPWGYLEPDNGDRQYPWNEHHSNETFGQRMMAIKPKIDPAFKERFEEFAQKAIRTSAAMLAVRRLPILLEEQTKA